MAIQSTLPEPHDDCLYGCYILPNGDSYHIEGCPHSDELIARFFQVMDKKGKEAGRMKKL